MIIVNYPAIPRCMKSNAISSCNFFETIDSSDKPAYKNSIITFMKRDKKK